MALVDGFDVAETPRCPTDGVLLREVAAGWLFPECGRFEPAMSGPLLPEFDGPSIHGG